jgi:hypothetical protein
VYHHTGPTIVLLNRKPISLFPMEEKLERWISSFVTEPRQDWDADHTLHQLLNKINPYCKNPKLRPPWLKLTFLEFQAK